MDDDECGSEWSLMITDYNIIPVISYFPLRLLQRDSIPN